MYITKPLTVIVSVRIEPTGSYNESLYVFERKKTLTKNTLQEVGDFLDGITALMKQEMSKLTVLAAGLLQCKNMMVAAQQELDKQIEHKETEEAQI